MDGAIILGGKKVIVPGVRVATWHDHGMTFDLEHAPSREEAIRWLVLHWTASERRGEAGAAKIHNTLTSRGLSVDFAITNEGDLWQFVDPLERRCRHASRANPYSIGVEVSAVGWVRPGRELTGDTAQRERYRATIHGWSTELLDYLEPQHRAVAGLADALVEGAGLEPRVEMAPYTRRSRRYLEAHGGVMGHLHCAAWVKHPKIDPGPRPLQRLAAHFEERRAA